MSAFLKAAFAEIAPLLVDLGYSPVPIRPGEKAPRIFDWQGDHPPSHYLPHRDPETGRVTNCAFWGTGILTAHTPAVDLDIRDRALVRVLIELAGDMLGPSPFRVGQPPKVILPFSTAEPFDKITGRWWAMPGDDWTATGYVPHRIEVLACGQQFVGYARHPRGTFYRWRRGEPIDTPLVDLPEIDQLSAAEFVAGAELVLANYGAVPLRRENAAFRPDIAGPERRRPAAGSIDSTWQALDPETLAKLLDAKHARRLRAGAWITSCPAHASQGHRSLSITPRAGGGSVVHCFGGCEFIEVARAITDIIGRRVA